jgi:copper transport protein
VLIAFGFFFLPLDSVEAHANQIRSSPSPDSELKISPERVIVWFSEPLEDSFSEVTVLNSVAERVDLGNSALDPSEPTAISAGLPPLAHGTYTVVWKNLSAVDGHKVVGSFVFAVGEPIAADGKILGAEQPLLQTVADPWLRWLVYIGLALVIGGLSFELLVVAPAIYSPSENSTSQSIGGAISATWAKVALAGFVVLVAVMFGQMFQAVSVLSGNSAFVPDLGIMRSIAFESGWGRFWTFRVITTLGVGILLALAVRAMAGDKDRENSLVVDSILAQYALVLGLVVIGLIAASSHSAASPTQVRALATVTDFVHLTASTIWIGGVIYLAIGVPHAIKKFGAAATASLLKSTLPRFSVVAVLSMSTLVATGIFSSYMHVTIPAAALSPYGWFLIGKLSLILPLFMLAGYNGFRLTKQLGIGGELRFGKTLLVELVLAVLVLTVVGWLTSIEPARQYAGRVGIGVDSGVAYKDVADDTEFDIEIKPAEVGKNDVTIRITDRNGEPIDNAIDVRARLKFIDDDLGEPLVSLVDVGEGVWHLGNALLNISGNYQAEVVIHRSDAFDARTAFRFRVRSVTAASDVIKPDTDISNLLFGLQMLIIGGIVMVIASRRKTAPFLFGAGEMQRTLFVPGLIVGCLGLLLVLNVQVFRVGLAQDLRNPFPLTSESVALGEPLYANACVTCHGLKGLGDGPSGYGLPKPPANLLVHVPLHSDTIMFEFIRDGIMDSGMPGQSGVLSEDEIWHLVNFLRAEFEE